MNMKANLEKMGFKQYDKQSREQSIIILTTFIPHRILVTSYKPLRSSNNNNSAVYIAQRLAASQKLTITVAVVIGLVVNLRFLGVSRHTFLSPLDSVPNDGYRGPQQGHGRRGRIGTGLETHWVSQYPLCLQLYYFCIEVYYPFYTSWPTSVELTVLG